MAATLLALPAVLATLLVAVTAAAPPASADTTATLTASDSVIADGCTDYPFTYDLHLPPGVTRWSATLHVSGHRLYNADEVLSSDDGSSPTGTSFTVCNLRRDGAGDHTFNLIGGTYSAADGTVGTITALVTFHLRSPRELTRLHVSTTRPRHDEVVRSVSQTRLETPQGFRPLSHTTVRLQLLTPGGWRYVFRRFRSHADGRDELLLRWNVLARLTFRLVAADGPAWFATKSRRVTIRTRLSNTGG